MNGITLIWRGVPAYAWVGVAYALTVLSAPRGATSGPALEAWLDAPLARLPLLGSGALPVSLTTLFVVAGFAAAWVEVIRATRLRDRGGNDGLSIVATIAAVLVFVGAAPFATVAFLVVPLAGLGDLLLDRLVGQAVARRDLAIG